MPNQPEIREFTGADFRSLAAVEQTVCLSMFVPNAGGEQAALAHGVPALKDLFRQAEKALLVRGVQSAEIDKWLGPLDRLLVPDLWRGTEPAVAVFRTRSSFYSFFVPARIASRVIVGNHFFLKPLIPGLTRVRRYYVLAISDNAARLFHCRDTECTEVHSEKMPGSLKEALPQRTFHPDYRGIRPERLRRRFSPIMATPRQ